MSKETRLLLLKRLHHARAVTQAALAKEIFYARLLKTAEQEEESDIKHQE